MPLGPVSVRASIERLFTSIFVWSKINGEIHTGCFNRVNVSLPPSMFAELRCVRREAVEHALHCLLASRANTHAFFAYYLHEHDNTFIFKEVRSHPVHAKPHCTQRALSILLRQLAKSKTRYRIDDLSMCTSTGSEGAGGHAGIVCFVVLLLCLSYRQSLTAPAHCGSVPVHNFTQYSTVTLRGSKASDMLVEGCGAMMEALEVNLIPFDTFIYITLLHCSISICHTSSRATTTVLCNSRFSVALLAETTAADVPIENSGECLLNELYSIVGL